MLQWKDEFHEILLSLFGGARYGVKIRAPHAVIMTCLFRSNLSISAKIRQIIQMVREHATNLALFAAIYKSVLLILKAVSHYIEKEYGSGNTETPKSRLLEYLRQRVRKFIYLFVFGSTTTPWTLRSSNNSMTIDNIHKSSSMAVVGYPQYLHHALIAGLIGGYTVWGRYTSINYQILLYLSSRVLLSLMQRLLSQTMQQKLQQQEETQLISRNASRLKSFQQLIKDRIYSLSAATIWGIVMFLFEDSPEFLHPSLKSSMDEIYRFSKRSE